MESRRRGGELERVLQSIVVVAILSPITRLLFVESARWRRVFHSAQPVRVRVRVWG